MTKHWVTYLLLSSCLIASGQKKSAQKLYKAASLELTYEKQIPLFEKAIAKDSTYTDAYLKLSSIYNQTKRVEDRINILQLANKNCLTKRKIIQAQLSHSAYNNGQYSIAFDAISQLDCKKNNALTDLKRRIFFAKEAIKTPTTFTPLNMGMKINTAYNDYWPSLSLNEKQIVTTVLVQTDQKNKYRDQEDFYQSKKINNKWTNAKPLSPIINTMQNEGAQCLSSDGNLMLFTACDRQDGMGSCDIFITKKKNNVWSPPIPLPAPINSAYWDGHPSLSADGKHLYFSSDRSGGNGGRDIYVASIEFSPRVIVTNIENLGDVINTSKNEISPFIHRDNNTLYFASDGHLGLGRFDLFMTHLNDTIDDYIVTNLGYPINTHQDEIGLIVNNSGEKAYFATDREDSRMIDIYCFDMPREFRPEHTTHFQVDIKDKESLESLIGDISIINKKSNKDIAALKQVSKCVLPLQVNQEYAITISSKDHLFYSENLLLDDTIGSAFEKTIYLSSIKKGERLILKNIEFEHNSYVLEKRDMNDLLNALNIIKNNPQLVFEVSGHTDKIGSAAYNLTLSENRAKAVYDFFVAKGVEPERLSYKGYGDTQPIATDNAQNRRTELLIK